MASLQDTNTESSQAPERESQTLQKTAEKQTLPTNGSHGLSDEDETAREKLEKTLDESKQNQELQKGEQNISTLGAEDSSKLETKEAEAPIPLQSQGSLPETHSTEVASNMQSRETPEQTSQQESLTSAPSVSAESHAAKEKTAKDSRSQPRSQGSSNSTQVTSNEAHIEVTSQTASQLATLEEPSQARTQQSEPTIVSPEKTTTANRTDKSQADGQHFSGSHPPKLEQRPQQAQQAHGDQQAQPQHQKTPSQAQQIQPPPPQGQHQPVIQLQQQQQAEAAEQEYVRLPGQATGHIVKKQRGRFKLLQEAPPPAAETQTTTSAPPPPPPPANIPPAGRERASSSASSKSNVSATANAQTFDGSGAPVVKRKGRFMVTNVKDPGLVAVPVQAVMTPVTTQPVDPSQASVSGDTDAQPIAYGAQMMMVTPAAHLSMPQQVQYTAAPPPQEGGNPATATLTFQQAAVAVQPPTVVGSAGPLPLPIIPGETALGPAAQPAAGDDPQAKAKPKAQPRKPTPHPNAVRAGGGLAGQTGLGKVFYFLDQMRLEVTEADKTIKTLQSDMKFLVRILLHYWGNSWTFI